MVGDISRVFASLTWARTLPRLPNRLLRTALVVGRIGAVGIAAGTQACSKKITLV